jgi:hypothetical protein
MELAARVGCSDADPRVRGNPDGLGSIGLDEERFGVSGA